MQLKKLIFSHDHVMIPVICHGDCMVQAQRDGNKPVSKQTQDILIKKSFTLLTDHSSDQKKEITQL